jgi:predicted Rossmann fold nucleotide-binding protein DprA/Smf involved in DNA uptake
VAYGVLPVALAAFGGPGAPVVAVAGSRSLPAGGSQLVASAARQLVAAGLRLVVGCAAGADAAAVAAVPPASARVLAAFGPSGAGAAGQASAVAVVQAFTAAGGVVSWWAGGGPGVPLSARLSARTRSVVAQASAGLVVFFASPASRGSALAACSAVGRGLPVIAFPLGFPASQLPSLGAGCWVPAGGAGVWSGSWLWSPEQGGFF